MPNNILLIPYLGVCSDAAVGREARATGGVVKDKQWPALGEWHPLGIADEPLPGGGHLCHLGDTKVTQCHNRRREPLDERRDTLR